MVIPFAGKCGKKSMRKARKAMASEVSTDSGERVFYGALLIFPAASAWLAFGQSAQAHALDVLLGQGACGNLFITPDAPVVFGHCLNCWSAGATAGAAALLAVLTARAALPLLPAQRVA